MRAKTDKIQGRAKQVEGKLTNDKLRMAQGTVQRSKGDIEGAFTRIGRRVKSGVRRAKAELRGAGRTFGAQLASVARNLVRLSLP